MKTWNWTKLRPQGAAGEKKNKKRKKKSVPKVHKTFCISEKRAMKAPKILWEWDKERLEREKII